jgi:hypothetical protein
MTKYEIDTFKLNLGLRVGYSLKRLTFKRKVKSANIVQMWVRVTLRVIRSDEKGTQ